MTAGVVGSLCCALYDHHESEGGKHEMRIILGAEEGPTSRVYRRRVLLIASVGLLAVMMGILAQFSQATSAPADRMPGGVPQTSPAERMNERHEQTGTLPAGFFAMQAAQTADPMSMGRADAPVVMVAYADFRCGHCGAYARDTAPAIERKYVEAGVLRIEFRNFPIRGADSYVLARAAWAAAQQGRFWQFHNAAFSKGTRGKAADDALGYARTAGVPDLARFAADAESPAARAAVDQNVRDGRASGVEMTPTFMINGKKVVGALPKETFFDEIDRAARTAKPAIRLPF